MGSMIPKGSRLLLDADCARSYFLERTNATQNRREKIFSRIESGQLRRGQWRQSGVGRTKLVPLYRRRGAHKLRPACPTELRKLPGIWRSSR